MYNLGLIDTPSGLFQVLRVNGTGVLTGVYYDASGTPLFNQRVGENGIELYNISGVNGVNVFQSGGLVYVNFEGGTGNSFTRLSVSGSDQLIGNYTLSGSGNSRIETSGNFIIVCSSGLLNAPQYGYGLVSDRRNIFFEKTISGYVTDVSMTNPTGIYGYLTYSYDAGAGNGRPWDAFTVDNNNPRSNGGKNGWEVSATTGEWLQFNYKSPQFVNSYDVLSYQSFFNGCKKITDWAISGSKDNANWVLLDRRTSQNPSSLTKYSFPTTDSYSHFRFITEGYEANVGNPLLAFWGLTSSGNRYAQYSDIQPINSGNGIGIFSHKDSGRQYFKTLSGLGDVTIYEQNGVIIISGSGGSGAQGGSFSGSGTLLSVSGSEPLFGTYNLTGESGVSIRIDGNNIYIAAPASIISGGGGVSGSGASNLNYFVVGQSGADLQNQIIIPPFKQHPDALSAPLFSNNDEFDGPINTLWSGIRTGSFTRMFTSGSHLLIDCPNQGTNRLYSLVQFVSGTNWEFRTKISVDSLLNNFGGVGVVIGYTGAAPRFKTSLIMGHSSYNLPVLLTINMNAPDGYVGEVANGFWASQDAYFRIYQTGNNVAVGISKNGHLYSEIYSENTGTFLGNVPNIVGYALHPYTCPLVVESDWFRRIS